MINIVLYKVDSITNITIRVLDYLHKNNYSILRTTEDTIWLNGLYIKINLKKKIFTINNYNNLMSKQEIINLLKYIFKGEEICVCIGEQTIYYKNVDKDTDFLNII